MFGLLVATLPYHQHTTPHTVARNKKGAETLRAQTTKQKKDTRLKEAVERIEQAWKCEQGSDEYKLTLQGPEHFFWRGSEAGLLRIFDFPGILAGGDGFRRCR
jgi:hypothetical protein